MLSVQAKIQNAAREEMGKNQKEYYLREQMKAIQQELGDNDGREELEELRKSIEAAKMPEAVQKEALKQLGRLERMHSDSGEAGVIRTYLDWLIDIPGQRPPVTRWILCGPNRSWTRTTPTWTRSRNGFWSFWRSAS